MQPNGRADAVDGKKLAPDFDPARGGQRVDDGVLELIPVSAGRFVGLLTRDEGKNPLQPVDTTLRCH